MSFISSNQQKSSTGSKNSRTSGLKCVWKNLFFVCIANQIIAGWAECSRKRCKKHSGCWRNRGSLDPWLWFPAVGCVERWTERQTCDQSDGWGLGAQGGTFYARTAVCIKAQVSSSNWGSNRAQRYIILTVASKNIRSSRSLPNSPGILCSMSWTVLTFWLIIYLRSFFLSDRAFLFFSPQINS